MSIIIKQMSVFAYVGRQKMFCCVTPSHRACRTQNPTTLPSPPQPPNSTKDGNSSQSKRYEYSRLTHAS